MKHFLHSVFVITLICSVAVGFGQTPDPGLPGPYDVSSDEYDFGDEAFGAPTFPDLIEVRGSVHYPTDLSAGPFPVLLFLHGRHSTCYTAGGSTSIAWPCTGAFDPIPSYQGYDYLAEQMASHGYIVVSVSANSISSTDNSTPDYGMRGRGELLQHHLDLWNDWNTAGGAPFGDLFVGKLDMDNIGTMGHSRGGEGVVEHALYNRELGDPYGIKAVLTLAPVDFNRPVLNGIPIMNIAPYCDGDVSDLQGVHYYDDARYPDEADTTAKYNLLMLGANHNFYNTVWTPGEFVAGTADDWGFVDWEQSDEHCGTGLADNGRYTPAKQRNALQAYASAFFRVHVGGETFFDPILKVTDIIPPASSTLDGTEIFMSYHPPSNKRVDVNRTDAEDSESVNAVDEAVSENGLLVYDICGDDFGEQYCIGVGAAQEPHNKHGGVSMLGLSQLEVQWNSADDWYRNDIPAFMKDFTQFEALQFRASVNFQESPADTELNFNVELVDHSGAIAMLPVADYSQALFFPPGDYGSTLPRIMHNTISIPIADFSGVDLTDIHYVRFSFNESGVGAILVADLAVSAAEELIFPPIADFAANVTETCDGEVYFTDESEFTPTTWAWAFGDGATSDEPNPVHTYMTNGTYTVSLTVTNEAGTDTETITSYVEVNRPDAPVSAGDVTICGPGEVTVSVTGSGDGTLNWYDEATGGTLLGTGTDFTESITETTTYYVSESVPNESMAVGPPDNTFGSGGYFGANDWRGLFFDAHAPFILESVRVYAQDDGDRTIQILDGDGGEVVHSTTVFIPDGESVVDLNFNIEPYSGYYMKITGDLVNLFRINDGSPSYPYEIPGLVSLTGSNVTGDELEFYYFFFDWRVRESDCISSRTLVTATVSPGIDVTASDDVTIASGETTTLTASGGVSYSWSPVTGLSDPLSATTDASPTETTTYTVTVEDADGCSGMAEVTVTIDGQVGISEVEAEQLIKLYPNPSDGLVYIQTEGVVYPYTVQVLSVDGKVIAENIFSTEKEINTVDLSGLSSGVYWVRVYNERVDRKEKLIMH